MSRPPFYQNPLYRAIQAAIPCALCGSFDQPREFYEFNNHYNRWEVVNDAATQSTLDTAYHVAGTVPLCGPCFRERPHWQLDIAPTITYETFNTLKHPRTGQALGPFGDTANSAAA